MDAERFAFRKLGDAMRDGVEPVDMLVPEWLPRGATVWLAAEPEAGKTWICLWLALRAMESGHRVAYIDAELGDAEVVRRLLLLGADPGVVDERLDYLAFPAWTLADAEAWAAVADAERWDLVVFETASDFLSDAGLNENDGLDVTEWAKAFPERVRVYGGVALVSDHVRKDGITNGYAVGSRSKKAKSQLGYEISVVRPYDAEQPGVITVTRTKNTFSAPVPKKRTLDIGPVDGFGTFDIRGGEARAEAREQDAISAMADVLCAALFDGGHVSPAAAVSQNTLVNLVSGNRKLKSDAAQLAATSPLWPVASFAHGANSIRYYATARDRAAGQVIPGDSGTTSESLGTGSGEPVPGPSIGSGTGTTFRSTTTKE